MSTVCVPAEWEPHERTLMGWPCRASSWGDTLAAGRQEFADVANTIADFEPVTMVCASESDAASARPQLSEAVEVIVEPMDGSWLRDNTPIFVERGGRREAVQFRFNAWGERHADRDRDARLGATLARRLGDPLTEVDVVLEGGAVAFDGAGTMVAPVGCVMHPTRNWHLTQAEVETAFRERLGIETMVWIPEGLSEDQERDPNRMYYGTDGHIDLFFDFIGRKRCLMLSVGEDDPNARTLSEARTALVAAGIEVIDFPFMGVIAAGSRSYIAPYLNFYVCNGAVLVPVAGQDPEMDAAALAAIAAAWPGRETVSVTLSVAPLQGGAIHCMTRQVPRRP